MPLPLRSLYTPPLARGDRRGGPRYRPLLLAGVLLLWLGGCGQKGPLVLPAPVEPVAAPAPPEEEMNDEQ